MSPRDPFAGVVAPRSGMVKLVASNGTSLTLIRNGDITRTGSVGGWQTSERTLREDADWWKSTPKGAYSIPCLLDIDAIGGPSLERRLDVLYAMGAPTADDDPPEIRLFGLVPAGTGPRWRWKLDDISLGTMLESEAALGTLRRIELTLEMSTFAPGGRVTAATIKRTRDTASSRRRRTLVAKKGDTLRAIAVRQLGSSGDYKLIRSWNPKLARVDPDAPLRAGTKVVLH